MTELTRDQFIHSAHEFMIAMSQFYGPQRGHELWTALGPVVGDDVQQEIFIRMLQVQSNTSAGDMVGFVANPTMRHNSVEAIKVIREASGIGLREAKDNVDAANAGVHCTVRCFSPEQANRLAARLTNLSYQVQVH
jgi:hypothetical protein